MSLMAAAPLPDLTSFCNTNGETIFPHQYWRQRHAGQTNRFARKRADHLRLGKSSKS